MMRALLQTTKTLCLKNIFETDKINTDAHIYTQKSENVENVRLTFDGCWFMFII